MMNINKQEYAKYVEKEIDRTKELKLDKEIEEKLGSIDAVLQKAMNVQIVTTKGSNKPTAKPVGGVTNPNHPGPTSGKSKIQPLKGKSTSLNQVQKRTRSVVGRRDQRFMFNNRNMKIGERRRNEMSKGIGSKDKSCKLLSQHKQNNMLRRHTKEQYNEGKQKYRESIIGRNIERYEEENKSPNVREQEDIREPDNEKPPQFKNKMKSVYLENSQEVL